MWRRSMRAEVYCTTPIQKYSTDGCDRSIEGQRRKPANAGWTSDVTQAGRGMLMKSLSEYLAYYDPMRESNERYLPEDQATLRYSRVSVIADGKVIGAPSIRITYWIWHF